MALTPNNPFGGDYRDRRVWISFMISIMVAFLFWYQSCVHMSMKNSPSGPVSSIIVHEYYPSLALRIGIALMWFGHNMNLYRKPVDDY